MTKYTVGEWRTHNGKNKDDMPEGLHRESIVYIRHTIIEGKGTAGASSWRGPLLWKLIKEHADQAKQSEPFECWVNVYGDGRREQFHYSYNSATKSLRANGVTKHMREVLE